MPSPPGVRCAMIGSMDVLPETASITVTTVADLDAAFEAMRPRLTRLCGSLVGAGDADDVVQDVYLVARDRMRQLNRWLRRCVPVRWYRPGDQR
jgi:DNA-directed RNA polymerase specialized sigma24 family protein